MNIENATKLVNRIEHKLQEREHLDAMYQEILETEELIIPLNYGNPFGRTVKVPVTIEALAAALMREIAIVNKEVESLSQEAGEALGV